MKFFNSLLGKVANSLKIRSGTPLDIRNKIEEAFFLRDLSDRAVFDMNLFIDTIRSSYREYDIRYFSKLQDGCYPLLSKYEYSNTVTISIGVGNNTLLDRSLSKLGSFVHMFDHTVKSPPENILKKFNFTFSALGLGVESRGALLSLADIISRSSTHSSSTVFAVLKIDCEGCEWRSLDSSNLSDIALFDQLIVEFHHLDRFTNPEFASLALSVMRKLTTVFDVAYVSPNNFSGSIQVTKVGFWPFTIEILFVRKSLRDLHLATNSVILPKLRNWKLGKDIDIASWTKGHRSDIQNESTN